MFNIVLALLAGVVTIAAPCTLPVLPILLGASIGQSNGLRPVFIAAGFVVSFATVALALSAIAQIFDFDPNILREVAAGLLIVFGLLMVWPSLFERLSVHLTSFLNGNSQQPDRQGYLGGFLLGTTLGLIWTPCAGPVLARS